jgi:hypothetical protein
VLLAAFALMPFSIFRLRAVTGSTFGMIFVLTLDMQQVLAYSPLETGLAWLAMALTALLTAVGARCW